MKNLMIGVALATLLGATPAAMAKDTSTKALKSQGAAASSMENANRHQNDDGTFQGKPVVQGPANWHDGSASTGASSGEAGSSVMPRNSDAK
jgi:hypothetical protein